MRKIHILVGFILFFFAGLGFLTSSAHSSKGFFSIFKVLSRASDSTALANFNAATDGANWTAKWTIADPMPTWFGVGIDTVDSTVVSLNLPNNNIVGTVPADFGDLNRLKTLDLSGNKLNGVIPDAFGNFDSLTRLNLSNNEFTGEVPAALGNLQFLTYLNLSGNQLTGVNAAVSNILVLDTVLLNDNALETLADFAPPLTVLDVSNNKLDFGDLEPNADIGGLIIGNQDSLGSIVTINAYEGTTFQHLFETDGTNFYKWFKAGVAIQDDFLSIYDTLTITNVTVDDAGIYVCNVINDKFPGVVLFSRAVIVNVLPCPEGNQVADDTTMCQNSPIFRLRTLNVIETNGLAISYQWQESVNDTLNWANVGAATAINQSIELSGLVDTTYYRRLMLTNECGTDTSNIVTISIVPEFGNNEITLDGTLKNLDICFNDSTQEILGTEGQNKPLSYQYLWQVSSSADTTWIDSLTTQNFHKVKLASDTVYLRRIVIGSCSPDTSNVFSINALQAMKQDSISNNQVICDNTLPQLLTGVDPVGGDGTFTYRWDKSFDQIVWQLADSSITTFTDTYQPDTVTQFTYFRRVVFGTCDSTLSNTIRIATSQTFGENSITMPTMDTLGRVDICLGDTIHIAQGTVAPIDSFFVFNWQISYDSANWGTVDSSQNFKPLDSVFTDDFFLRRLVIDSCTTLVSNVLSIDIIQKIDSTSNIIKASLNTLCAGDTSTYWEVTAPVGRGDADSLAYQWQVSFDSAVWADADTSQNLQDSSLVLQDTAYFRRLIIDSCFTDTSNVVQINVLQYFGENLITIEDTIFCQGDTGIVFLGSEPSTTKANFTYDWQQSTDSILWFSIVDTSVQNLAIDSFFITNSTYFRRVVSGGCTPDTSNSIFVSFIPLPLNNLISFSNTDVCAGDSLPQIIGTIPVGTDTSNYMIRWESSLDSVDWINLELDSGETFSYTPDPLEDTTYFRRVVGIDNACPSSFSNPIRLNVIPRITNNLVSGDTSICEGDSLYLSGTLPIGGDQNYIYTWQSLKDSDSVYINVSGQRDLAISPPSRSGIYRRIVKSLCFSDTSLSIHITVNPKIPENIITGNQTICKYDTISEIIGSSLQDTLGVLGPFNYQWQIYNDSVWIDITNALDSNFRPDPLDTTRHFRRLIINDCFQDASNAVTIRILDLPNVQVSPDSAINIGSSVQLEATGAITYVWTPSDGLDNDSIANPIATPRINTLYIVEGTDLNGCRSTDSVQISIIDVPEIDVVDAITPNGDRLNDFLYAEGLELFPENTLIVFDRRGREIYRKEGYQNDWNGTYNGNPLPSGTYFYLIRLGSITKKVIKGSFLIINE